MSQSEAAAPSIRRARADDAAAYRAMRLEALRAHPIAFGGDPSEEEARPLSFWQERLRPESNPHSASFVADVSGELAGMMVVVRASGAKLRHAANIYSVYVRPAWRGRGVADQLLEACVAWARAEGVQLLKLAVAAQNLAALGFYQRNRFRIYGVEPQAIMFAGQLHDELLLIRAIAGAREEGPQHGD
jgi:ribosomal protein S18 acetylase RimI-like enzyme